MALPEVAISTAPGVDQAVIIGMRYRQDRMREEIAMPKHSAAAQEACWEGVAPAFRAASMIRRIVEAKPTTTAVSVAETRLNQPAWGEEGMASLMDRRCSKPGRAARGLFTTACDGLAAGPK